MKCLHCQVAFHEVWASSAAGEGDATATAWVLERVDCPSCRRCSFRFHRQVQTTPTTRAWEYLQIWPRGASRPAASVEVPSPFAGDYAEACLVLHDSPKASAALSRRTLQQLLREKAETKGKDLFEQIQEVLDGRSLPSHLAKSVDAVRVVGNFAAHPIKSQSTGEIVEVEPGEAEWNLDTLELLFDFYFVQPAITKGRLDSLNQKLADAGKPPLQ